MALLREKVYVVEIYRDLFKCAQNLSPHSKYQICLTNPGPYKYTHTKDVQLCLPLFSLSTFFLLFSLTFLDKQPQPRHHTTKRVTSSFTILVYTTTHT